MADLLKQPTPDGGYLPRGSIPPIDWHGGRRSIQSSRFRGKAEGLEI